ncbi:hypothetical protein T484DRAFT_2281107 [Baffinella frigidus]|nr:hypothetical protein T484DRAFT_2281107 [Cryptophyta sp. CCMP2293]
MIRARLAFPGPIFGKREAPDQESMEDNDPLLVKGAGGILHVRDIEGHIPGSMFVPAGKPDTCPTPPKLPSRMDLARASRKSPGFTFKAKSMQDRANFLARYGPIKYGSGVPKPPPPPQAKKYFPLPWEQLPAHKLKMRGLPMVCTEDDILAFLGKHAADVQDIVREGFKKGIKIFKLADRWLTGEAHLVMKSRRAALDTILYMDKKIMGRRVIHLDYLIEEIPVPRGRIMLGGIHRRTTENDLEEFFRGWDLVAEEGQGPEIFGDIQGEPTGDALVIFETVEASDTVLRLFDFSQRLRGVELTYEPMLPMKFDPVAEKWEDMDVFMYKPPPAVC